MARQIASILSIIALVVSWLVFGALAGATVVSRLMEPAADGWTQIADALGGLMVGGLLGSLTGAALAVRSPERGRWIAAGIGGLGIGVLFLVLVTTEPRKASFGPVEAQPPNEGEEVGSPTVDVVEPMPTEDPEPPADEDRPWLALERISLETIEGRIPCEGDALRSTLRFDGEMMRGESFTRSFGPGLRFEIVPTDDRSGWTIRVISEVSDSETPPLTELTPPLRGPRPIELEAWHFLDADGDAINRGEVNAPQRLRLFTFSPEVPLILARPSPPTPEDLEAARAVGRGALEILELDLGRPAAEGDPRTATIERLLFTGCLSWPSAMAGRELATGD